MRRDLPIALCLSAACVAVYSSLWKCDFVNYDDEMYITGNPYLPAHLDLAAVRWGLTTFYASNWHPLTWWSLILDRQFYGLSPAGYHLTNLLWHIGSTLLLFAALRRLTGAVWPSALVAALFAVHPLNVQSVAWISERKGVVSTFFWMLTLWCYARYAERPSLGRYALVAGSFAAGLLAKQMLVTLPLVLLLLDYWPLRRKAILEKLPLVLLAVAAGMLTVAAQAQGGAVAAVGILSPAARLKNALLSYLVYVGQACYPVNLAAFYMHPGDATPLTHAAAAAVVLAAITIVALALARRWPYLAVGWLWYAITLLPVIGLAQVGFQAHADRYAYVPMVGIFIAVAWGLAEAARAWGVERLAAALAGLAVAICAILSWQQVAYWQNSTVLWENAIAVTGGSPVAHSGLGMAYLKEAFDKDGALEQFRNVVKLDPSHQQAHVNIGMLLMERLDLAGAAVHFQEALRYVGDNALAQSAHLGLGLIKTDRGDLDGARAHFETALRIDPRVARAHSDMGLFLARSGDRAAALARFQEALKLEPSNAATHLNLGSVLLEEGKLKEAGRHFAIAGQAAPRTAEAYLWNQAVVWLAKDNLDAAVFCLRAAPRADTAPARWEEDYFVLDALAAGYARLGKISLAVETSRRAQQCAAAAGRPELAAAIEARRRGFEGGKQ